MLTLLTLVNVNIFNERKEKSEINVHKLLVLPEKTNSALSVLVCAL